MNRSISPCSKVKSEVTNHSRMSWSIVLHIFITSKVGSFKLLIMQSPSNTPLKSIIWHFLFLKRNLRSFFPSFILSSNLKSIFWKESLSKNWKRKWKFRKREKRFICLETALIRKRRNRSKAWIKLQKINIGQKRVEACKKIKIYRVIRETILKSQTRIKKKMNKRKYSLSESIKLFRKRT